MMSTILLTGASGFLGNALLLKLSKCHHVVTMGRKPLPAAPNQTHFTGVFSDPDAMRQLDGQPIDAVVHLAAVTGGCSERDGLLVNVEGTRALMRALMDRGCLKFVLASSIAVVGLQNPAFRPLSVPIADDHPCLDRDGYGFSKAMMEEVTHYLYRQHPGIDVIDLRLAALYPDEQPPAKVKPGAAPEWCLAHLTQLSQTQAVEVFVRAVESEYRPGVRVLNAVGRQAWTDGPVASVLRSWWGDDIDLSWYEKPGRERASVFAPEAVERELGFAA